MNTSYNYSDFIGLSLDSNDDYESYGYDMEALQAVEAAHGLPSDFLGTAADHALLFSISNLFSCLHVQCVYAVPHRRGHLELRFVQLAEI